MTSRANFTLSGMIRCCSTDSPARTDGSACWRAALLTRGCSSVGSVANALILRASARIHHKPHKHGTCSDWLNLSFLPCHAQTPHTGCGPALRTRICGDWLGKCLRVEREIASCSRPPNSTCSCIICTGCLLRRVERAQPPVAHTVEGMQHKIINKPSNASVITTIWLMGQPANAAVPTWNLPPLANCGVSDLSGPLAPWPLSYTSVGLVLAFAYYACSSHGCIASTMTIAVHSVLHVCRHHDRGAEGSHKGSRSQSHGPISVTSRTCTHLARRDRSSRETDQLHRMLFVLTATSVSLAGASR